MCDLKKTKEGRGWGDHKALTILNNGFINKETDHVSKI